MTLHAWQAFDSCMSAYDRSKEENFMAHARDAAALVVQHPASRITIDPARQAFALRTLAAIARREPLIAATILEAIDA